MTPTLAGRIQTRLFVMLTFGLIVSLIVGAVYQAMGTFIALWLYLLMVGLIAEPLYDYLQNRRWEEDWPPILFTLGTLAEGAIVWILVSLIDLPAVPKDLAFAQYLVYFILLFFALFIGTWGGMKVIFIKWRFRGGRVLVD